MKDDIHRLLVRLDRLDRAKQIGAPHDIITAISHSVMSCVSNLNADDLLQTHKMWAPYIKLVATESTRIDNLTEEEFNIEMAKFERN